MWYYKVITGILLFPWSLALLMVAASARHRRPREARSIVLPPTPIETPQGAPLAVPQPAPAPLDPPGILSPPGPLILSGK
jgi:hypothetical protein